MKNFGKCVAGIFLVLAQAPGQAADISRTDTNTALNLSGAWAGGVVPGSGDIAVWDSTLTADRGSAIGANLNLGGIRVSNPGGSTYTINGTTGASLTLGSSGIDMSAATANLSIGAVLDLSASQTWNVASGRTLTLSGANTGAGTLSLTGAGTFALGNNLALGTGTVNIGGGAHLTSTTASSRILANAINLNGDMRVSMTGAANSLMVLNGGMDIGTGTRTISIANSNGSATNPSLAFNGGGAAAGKEITGSGRLVFANGNVATTPMVAVRMGNSSTDYAVVRSDVTIGNGVTMLFQTSNVFTNESDLTVEAGGVFNMSNNSGASASQTIASLSGAGLVTNYVTNVNSATLTIDGGASTGSSTFTGLIQNGASGGNPANGVISLVKNGTSTQILTGTNNYSGATTINGGTLLVNGSHIQAAAAGNNGYTVNSGGTLGGTGTLARMTVTNNQSMVTVASGGTLAPGGDGTLGSLKLDGQYMTAAIGNRHLTMQSGAELSFELGGDGASADTLDFWNYSAGDLTLNGNAIDFDLVGTQVAGTYTVDIFRFYSDGGSLLTTSGISSGLVLGDLGVGIDSASIIYNSAGGLIQLQYTVAAVPEPSTYALLGIGLAGLCLLRRRKA